MEQCDDNPASCFDVQTIVELSDRIAGAQPCAGMRITSGGRNAS